MVGLLAKTAVSLLGAGERAAGMAEELALEERFRDSGAVDGDEWTAPARGVLVDRAREYPFPGSALSGKQDRSVDGCRAGAEGPDRHRGRAVAQDCGKGIAAVVCGHHGNSVAAGPGHGHAPEGRPPVA